MSLYRYSLKCIYVSIIRIQNKKRLKTDYLYLLISELSRSINKLVTPTINTSRVQRKTFTL